ncbi:hypothetical protein V6N13_005932 [Hibiscus sabdariffa]
METISTPGYRHHHQGSFCHPKSCPSRLISPKVHGITTQQSARPPYLCWLMVREQSSVTSRISPIITLIICKTITYHVTAWSGFKLDTKLPSIPG